MFRDNDGKTEDATPGRMSEAANKGQVAISREFTMAASLLFAILMLWAFGEHLFGALQEVLRRGLNVNPALHPIHEGSVSAILAELRDPVWTMIPPLLGFLLVFLFSTAAAGYGQIGLRYRGQALKFRFEKLNPTKNVKSLVSFQSIARTFISVLKLTVLGGVLWVVVGSRIERFAGLYHTTDLRSAIQLIVETAVLMVIAILTVMLVIAILDLIYQRWDHKEGLKMSKQEVEDERKRSDGDPFVKGRLRDARRELMRQRMMDAVPEADVIITNPTHYAIALAYDRTKNAAPQVVAKGVDELALRIREIAEENDVARVEDPPLARALFRAVKVGHEVPERFYQAVATILGHVFRMKGRGSAA